MKLIVEKENDGQRLDIVILNNEGDISRSLVSRSIKDGNVSIDKTIVTKPAQIVHVDQCIVYELQSAQQTPDFPAIELDLEIIYEDKSYLVINKPAGISTHPSITEKHPTLLQGVMWYLGKDFLELGKDSRYGLVHRLDKDTSGVIVFAKTSEALWSLSSQFQKRQIRKEYSAVVVGNIGQVFDSKRKSDGVSLYPTRSKIMMKVWLGRNPVNRMKHTVVEEGKGRFSETKIIVNKLSRDGNYCIVDLFPKTGRTHQLRVHLSSLKYPIVGDKLYGNDKEDYMLLHAQELQFYGLDGKQMHFKAEKPSYFKDFIEAHFD